jgi:MFS family permease
LSQVIRNLVTIVSTAAASLPHTHRPGTIRAALSYRRFRIVFVAVSLSNVGTWMQNFALPAYIDHRTGSAAMVGLLVFAQLGPMFLLSIPAGALADRVDRTRLVVAMQVVMLSMSVLLAVLAASDAPIGALFAAQLGIGIANSIQAPAFAASLPLMVDRADLPGAVSLNSAQINGSRIAGPALAALLAALGVGIPGLFAFNAATYVFLIVPLVMLGLPEPPRSAGVGDRFVGSLTRGVRTALGRAVLRDCVLTMFFFSLVCLPFIGLFPSVARLNLGLSPDGGTYKALYITWGAGALLGALAIGSWIAHHDKRRVVRVGLAAFAVCLAVFALLSNLAAAFVVAAVLGFVYFAVATALASIFQQNLANTERGTVMPLWFMAFGGTVPLGNLIGGPIVDRVGARPVLLVGAAAALVLAELFDLRKLTEGDFLPVDLGGEPFTPVEPSRLF